MEEIVLEQRYNQREPENGVLFVRVFSLSREKNLAFGRKVYDDGSEDPKHTVYNMRGSYLCGRPDLDLVGLYQDPPPGAEKKPKRRKKAKATEANAVDVGEAESDEGRMATGPDTTDPDSEATKSTEEELS